MFTINYTIQNFIIQVVNVLTFLCLLQLAIDFDAGIVLERGRVHAFNQISLSFQPAAMSGFAPMDRLADLEWSISTYSSEAKIWYREPGKAEDCIP